MRARTEISSDEATPPFDVLAPTEITSPVLYASPHSGTVYPRSFVAASALDARTLRRSEDSFVDDLFAAAPGFGSPLLRALYARVYLDVNREPFELDPAMFEDELPPHINTTSLRVAGGLGTIARVVADGAEVYRDKLPYAEAERRVRKIYYPYHRALQDLIDRTRELFGCAVLIDCHSMPSMGSPTERDGGRRRPDVVLGDRFGTTCAPAVIDLIHSTLAGFGYLVGRNNPYAGGFTTYHYGRPAQGVHVVQIEINRGIYMDEEQIGRLPAFGAVVDHVTSLIRSLSELNPVPLAAQG